MTVAELLPFLNENRTTILKIDDKEAARYDGRNSIPHELDSCEIVEVNIEDGAFIVDAIIPTTVKGVRK